MLKTLLLTVINATKITYQPFLGYFDWVIPIFFCYFLKKCNVLIFDTYI